MTLFQTLNVAGPANRGSQIQQMAQNAAQNVLRRQKMRALLQNGAQAAAGGGGGGGGQGGAQMIRSSFAHQPAAHDGRPLTPQQLAAMSASAGAHGGFPGGGPMQGGSGFMNAGGGGGFDYGALAHMPMPGGNDPGPVVQSPGSQAPGANPQSQAPGTSYVNPQTGVATGNTYQTTPYGPPGTIGLANPQGQFLGDSGINVAGGGLAQPPSSGLIPLGNGQFYDPATDAIHTPGRQQ